MSHTKGSSDVWEEERLSRNVRDRSHNVAAPAVPGPFGARGPCSPHVERAGAGVRAASVPSAKLVSLVTLCSVGAVSKCVHSGGLGSEGCRVDLRPELQP